jgi:hypothetical protein
MTLTRRAYDRPGLSVTSTDMAWRPHGNLIDGELDNRTSGKVVGWIRFYRQGMEPLRVVFDLEGDFHEDIRGRVIRLLNSQPSDRNGELDREGTYMEDFSPLQRGTVGDITAGLPLGPWTEALARKLMAQHELGWDERGLQESERDGHRREIAERHREHIAAGDLFYPYVDYPYIEWYSDNGRVVLELEPVQVEILGTEAGPIREKTPEELRQDDKRRVQAFGNFLGGMMKSISAENRRQGGDGDVVGAVIG